MSQERHHKYDIAIIIPFLNEESNIEHLHKVIQEFTELHHSIAFEIIYVDDGSTDASYDVLTNLQHKNPTSIVKLSKNFGSHAALRAGISNAQAELCCFLYADLQDPIDNIFLMYEKMASGAFDIVWAKRKEVAAGLIERLFSKGYAKLMRTFVNSSFPENGYDNVMFNSKVAKALKANEENHSSIFLQILSFGFRQSQIEYVKKQRLHGKTKWTFSKKLKLVIDSFIAFSYFPIRLVTLMGFLFFILGVAWSLYLVFRTLFKDDLLAGWPMLLSVILISFGLTNISLGIIAEYLWRTLDASRRRPVYIIDEVSSVNYPNHHEK